MKRLDLIWQVTEKVGTMNVLNTPGRRLSVSRMRENLMSGSMWQGMETRHGDGTEALSEEMESNGSATPKSRRHPLTLPPRKAIEIPVCCQEPGQISSKPHLWPTGDQPE